MTTPYKHLSLAMRWRGQSGFDQDLSQALTLIRYLPDRLFKQYDPDRYSSFLDRFDAWLENVNGDEEKKDFVRLIRHILFCGKEEMDALMRSAFSVNVSGWLVDQIGKSFFDPRMSVEFEKAIEETWFCSVTDMNISAFYHINNLRGDVRPDWNSLGALGDSGAIRDYIDKKKIKRVVLLEDFVGSGRQMARIVRAAKKMLPLDIPTLFCPLMICPAGDACAKKLASSMAQFSYSPAMAIPDRKFIQKRARRGETDFFARLRGIIKKYEAQVQENPTLVGTRWAKNPFGYQGAGALVVMHTNCPNNTIRIVHHSKNWAPLFTRSDR